jgi:hypothetical protein
MRYEWLPSGPLAQYVSHQARQFLVNQAVTTALGGLICLAIGQGAWVLPWALGSLAGFVSIILSAWSTVWTLGARQAKAAVIWGVLLVIVRWLLVGGLLMGAGLHTATEVGVALLACFGYNYAMPVRWVLSQVR